MSLNRRRMLLSQIKNDLYLYNRGDECVEVTGGWENWSYNRGNDIDGEVISEIQKNEDHLRLHVEILKETHNRTATFATLKKIDLTGYDSIEMEIRLVHKNSEIVSDATSGANLSIAKDLYNADWWEDALIDPIDLAIADEENEEIQKIVVSVPELIDAMGTSKVYFYICADTWSHEGARATIELYSLKLIGGE